MRHQELLKASATEVRLDTRVTGVVGSAKSGYSLIGGAQDKLGTFDAVVIAAPLVLAGIELDVRGEVRIKLVLCVCLAATAIP